MARLTLVIGIVMLLTGIALGQDQPTSAPAVGTYADRLHAASATLNAARLADDRTSKQKLYREAAAALDALVKENPQSIEAKLLTAELFADANIGRSTEAQTRFREVLRDDGTNYRALLGLGRIHCDTGLYRNALELLKKALTVAPPDGRLEVLRLLAMSYNGIGQPEKALETANEALSIDPKDINSLQIVVRLRRDWGKWEEANASAKQLVEQCLDAWRRQPTEMERLKALDGAYDLQLSVLGYNRRDGMLQSLMEKDERGNYVDQVRRGQEHAAGQVSDQIASVVYAQANVKQLLMIYDALTVQRRAVEYDSKNPQYLRMLARMQSAVHDLDGAYTTYQRLLALDPQDSEATEFLKNFGPTSRPGE